MAGASKRNKKYEWDLSKFFYSSPKDPQIAKDVAKIKRAIVAFEKKYRDTTDWLTNADTLLAALQADEKLGKVTYPKPLYYLSYLNALDSSDTEVEALLNKLTNELTPYENRLVFFGLRLAKITPALQKKVLKDKRFARYHYMLKRIFDTAKYDLSEPEEKILNLMAQPSRGMWMQGVEKLLNKQEIAFKKKKLPINAALEELKNLKTTDRRKLWKEIATTLRDNVSDFAESEINALYTKKKITDELRGFSKPYSSTLLGNQNTEASIDRLVAAVNSHASIGHRFFKLKAKMLGMQKLQYVDRLAQVGEIKKKFSFDEAYAILQESFERFDPQYKDILDRMMRERQIDVFPRKGKTGGAFCSHSTGGPTLVLLNHGNNFNSVKTFAHEMGHAFHSELSRSQPPHYQNYSTATAETASTFFENIVFDTVFETLSDKEKIIALHDRISDAIATVFRQIAVFGFELELHERVRANGFVSKEEMGALLNDHMKKYLGPAVTLTPDDGYFFVIWSHIRNFFYVYTYAYGFLVSSALYRNYLRDASFANHIATFLKAGGSMSPDALFKTIGVDPAKPAFFADGLAHIATDLKRLKTLVDKKR